MHVKEVPEKIVSTLSSKIYFWITKQNIKHTHTKSHIHTDISIKRKKYTYTHTHAYTHKYIYIFKKQTYLMNKVNIAIT